jgi:transposase InsO family protein
MDVGRFVVEEHVRTGRPVGELARSYGVHRSWIYKRLKRYRLEGEAGLELRSRRPTTSPTKVGDRFEDEIVALRKELLDFGSDAGAATIQSFLARRHDKVPSMATIWRVLKARGFVTPQPQKRPKSSYKTFCADLPNERWQADTTHWTLADGSGVEILNVIDDHSRLCIAAKVYKTTRSADVVRTLHVAGGKWGYPATMLTDNGAIFTATHHGGEAAMEAELWSLGIKVSHSRPYHPQTQGKVERFHQTVKKFLVAQDAPETQKQLQGQLNRFITYYNEVRPHRALGRRTPSEVFNARSKDAPRGPRIEVGGYRVLRNRVDAGGRIAVKYRAKQYHVGVGKRFVGTRVIVLVAGRQIKVLQHDGTVIRNFKLDPSHDYQRLP